MATEISNGENSEDMSNPEDKMLKCFSCSSRFSKSGALIIHIKSMHMNKNQEETEKSEANYLPKGSKNDFTNNLDESKQDTSDTVHERKKSSDNESIELLSDTEDIEIFSSPKVQKTCEKNINEAEKQISGTVHEEKTLSDTESKCSTVCSARFD